MGKGARSGQKQNPESHEHGEMILEGMVCVKWVPFALAAVCAAAGPEACASGRALFAKRDFAAAQAMLWGCVEAGAASKDSAYELTHTYRELKNYDAGLARAKTVSKTVDSLYVKAFLLFRTGAHRESVDTLGEAYRIDKADWRVHHLFGLNYVVLDIPEGARQELEEAVKLNPGNAELWYHLARFFYSQNRAADSLAASERALSLAPGYVDVHGNMALCHEALSKPEQARRHYETAIELNRKLGRKDEWPLLDFAAFLIKEERLAESLAAAEQALALNPESGRAHYLRGKALRKSGRLADARLALERAIALDGKEPGPFYEMGALLRKLGDAEGSRRMYGRFQELSRKKAPRAY